MENLDQQIIKVREDLAEVKTDVKHVLLHLERQNGRIGRLEEDVDQNKSEVQSFFMVLIPKLFQAVLKK
jgi:hypothetical protein